MKITPLPLETVARTGYTHKFNITYADVLALGATAAGHIHLLPEDTSLTLPAGTVVRAVGYELLTGFTSSDADANSLLMEIGFPSAGVGLCLHDKQLLEAATEVHWHAENTNTTGVTLPYCVVSAEPLIATFTVAVGAGTPLLSEINAGEINIFVGIFDLNNLEKN